MSVLKYFDVPADSVRGQLSHAEMKRVSMVYAVSSGTIIAILTAIQTFATWVDGHAVGLPPWVTVVASLIAGVIPMLISAVHSLMDGTPATPATPNPVPPAK